MHDPLGRTVNYLRLSITDRCNLRCCYCMPAEGVASCGHDEILRYEELLRIAKAAIALGVRKVRVTGGEPLVRKGVVSFLEQLCRLPGLDDVSLTTNGLLLPQLAVPLQAVGVRRLNVSLDSLDPAIYAQITRGGDLQQVREGLEVAERAGLRLKLNMVVMRGINDREVEEFAALTLDRPWSVRFIEYMPTIRETIWRNRVISGAEVQQRLERRFAMEPLTTTALCGPARPYRIRGAAGTLGFITPMSDHFCGACNRIRVTSRGLAKSCLLSDTAIDLKPALVREEDKLLQQALLEVVQGKRAHHHAENDSSDWRPFAMASIGG
jgi:cyclic pyranopterin phosphate synthase